MKDLPNSFWAVVLIAMAVVLAIVCLFAPVRENVTMAVATMAASIVTGAFGYIQGVKDGKDTVRVPLSPDTTTTVNVDSTK